MIKKEIIQYLDKEIRYAEELEEYYWECWKQKQLGIYREAWLKKRARREALEDVRRMIKESGDERG